MSNFSIPCPPAPRKGYTVYWNGTNWKHVKKDESEQR